MTVFETKQHRSVFFEAGLIAWRIGVHFQNCPYKLEPYRTGWQKGWMSANKAHNAKFRTKGTKVTKGNHPTRG